MNNITPIINDNFSKLLCFIIPYFGCLPETMQVFLDSAKRNPHTDFILLTDDRKKLEYPPNIKVIYCEFSEIKNKIQSCFDFEISLDNAKKLCDYKPAYGFVFENELKNYKYWGYCDLDIILGRIDEFINENFLEKYDKVFTLGHMSIFRNTDSVNTLFKRQFLHPNAKHNSYRQVFSSPKNLVFDEWPENTININVLAEQENFRLCGEWLMADILPHRSNFQESVYDYDNHSWSDAGEPIIVVNCTEGLFTWRINLKTGEVCAREILYAHIQKRTISMLNYDKMLDNFVIIPNKIVSLSENISTNNLRVFYKKMLIRNMFKADEFLWKFQLIKGIWKHRIKKIFNYILIFK